MTTRAQPAPAGGFNVMSFNLRYDHAGDGPNAWPHRREMAAAVFSEHRVGLAGLQEALKGMIDNLQRRLPGYGWIGAGRTDGREEGEFAPIFYDRQRFELGRHGNFWLSDTPETPGVGWDALLPRVVTWGVFTDRITGQACFFLNTHFDHRGAEARLRSARLIVERIASLGGGLPAIMTGDLNSTPGSPVIATLTGDPAFKLTDGRQISAVPHVGGSQSANAFQTPGPELVIDYILVGPGVEVQTHGYHPKTEGGVFVSDHWPVVSRVCLPAG